MTRWLRPREQLWVPGRPVGQRAVRHQFAAAERGGDDDELVAEAGRQVLAEHGGFVV